MERFSIDESSQAFKNLSWSNFFSKQTISSINKKHSEILLEILKDKWSLEKHDIDLVVMYHSFIYKEKNNLKKLESFMRLEGTNNFNTAMSKTVGLPIALLIETIITNKITTKTLFPTQNLLPYQKGSVDQFFVNQSHHLHYIQKLNTLLSDDENFLFVYG